ncbi:MAG TPA: M20 family metallopeptidase [Gaiellaceae bacterium]|nr:M20 family metallopeptidase [Gaiellaceae bacterium]
MSQPPASLLDALGARTPEMLEALRALVEVESPTAEPDACAACAEVADELGLRLLGARAERIASDGRVHLRWRFGEAPAVLLVGHLDTVWPLGTLARWPFEVRGDTATGPGVFDMKAGVAQLFFALSALDDLRDVAILLTTDEEIGAPTSRTLIAETARGIRAALVLEPSAHGALKTERKGVSVYRITAVGKAAHAGLDPEKGANAAVELAHQLVAVAALSRPDAGTTVTPSLLTAGTAINTVPARAASHVDVRTRTRAEAERVRAALLGLRPVVTGTALTVEETVSVPPLERIASEALYRRAERLAAGLGLAPLREAAVGGGSDGNLVASLGVPVLDGLGAVGDHAHAEGEYVEVPRLAERAALVAALVEDLRA